MSPTRIQCRATPRTQAPHTRPAHDRGRGPLPLAESGAAPHRELPPPAEEDGVLVRTVGLNLGLGLGPDLHPTVRAHARDRPPDAIGEIRTLLHHIDDADDPCLRHDHGPHLQKDVELEAHHTARVADLRHLVDALARRLQNQAPMAETALL